MSTSYSLGQSVRLRLALTDEDGAPEEQPNPRICYRKTDGTNVTVSDLRHDGVGLYSCRVACDLIGMWSFRGESDDAVSEDQFFEVLTTSIR